MKQWVDKFRVKFQELESKPCIPLNSSKDYLTSDKILNPINRYMLETQVH